MARQRSQERVAKEKILTALRCLFSFLFLLLSLSAAGDSVARQRFPAAGMVTGVSDGDTIKVRFSDGVERRVRLIGVDSPEVDDPREDAAFWAFLAERFTFFHLYGRHVRLQYDISLQDEYGRVLAYVEEDSGRLFNEFLIREGYASAFFNYPFRRDYRERFRQAEAEAEKEGRGLWRRGEPELVPAAEARSRLGECVRVRFDCAGLSSRRGFLFLRSAEGKFEALIPRNRLALFPKAQILERKALIVTGFLEEFGGRPQIVLFFPRQLRLL